jgi:hypothetical protein
MALYNELPVNKATYDLLLAIFQFTKKFNEEVKVQREVGVWGKKNGIVEIKTTKRQHGIANLASGETGLGGSLAFAALRGSRLRRDSGG